MITIIKLGGSLLAAAVLPACLQAVGRCGGRVLIVPGGGVFADQVRSAQRQWGFDDVAAHRMAILAMQQMACLFHSLQPNYPVFNHADEASAIDKAGIWSPEPDELDRAGITPGWEITSDSLAAWLAGQVGADQLWLVKSCALEGDQAPSELGRQGIVDRAFSGFVEGARFKTRIVDLKGFLALP